MISRRFGKINIAFFLEIFMNTKTSIAIKQLKALEKLVNNSKSKNLRLAAEWKEKWKILISTILSSQTKDETTIRISEILFKKYLNIKRLAKAKLKDIKKIIKPVNFYKTKANNIKKTADIISKAKKGKIPEKIDELLKLPGVGRKVANVYLAVAHKKDTIGVDTHVSRLAVKLGWTKNKQSQKYKIEKDLEKLFPKKYWRSINYILVRFGRVFGKSRKKEDEILRKL